MTKRPTKYEPPLALDMDFGEALDRFGLTDKNEAVELATRAKKKKAEKVTDPPSQVVKNKDGNG